MTQQEAREIVDTGGDLSWPKATFYYGENITGHQLRFSTMPETISVATSLENSGDEAISFVLATKLQAGEAEFVPQDVEICVNEIGCSTLSSADTHIELEGNQNALLKHVFPKQVMDHETIQQIVIVGKKIPDNIVVSRQLKKVKRTYNCILF